MVPQRYRETQADWFVKRGISWHVSVVVRRFASQLKQQTFVHIIEECNQDANAVVQVLQHTLKTLKANHPEVSTAALRQDNAGCYHSVVMLTACRLMGERPLGSVSKGSTSVTHREVKALVTGERLPLKLM